VAAAAGATDGLLSIPTTVTAVGSYSELTLYLQKLQSSMRRAFLVNTIALVPANGATGTATGDLTMTLNAEIFVMAADAPATPKTPVAPTTTSAS
jgi:hypothetical protein